MAEILFPPVGVAHLTRHPLDLIVSRVGDAVDAIDLACVTQPKAEPHLGTAVLLYTAFALAAEARRVFDRDTRVVLDVLENSPGHTFTEGGRRFFVPLSHVLADGETAAELATKPLRELCVDLEQRSGVRYQLRSYAAVQRQRSFRAGLGTVLGTTETFAPILAPHSRRLLVRPLCPQCGIGEKDARTLSWVSKHAPQALHAECPTHGPFTVRLDDRDAVIDCNTPLRTLLRSYAFTSTDASERRLTVLLNGADWAGEWMQHVYLAGLDALGVRIPHSPPNFFAPLVVDESGAKLSKTIYLEPGAYDHLSVQWRSYEAFCRHFGGEGKARLWHEVSRWVREPKRFFRNYSLAYLDSVIG